MFVSSRFVPTLAAAIAASAARLPAQEAVAFADGAVVPAGHAVAASSGVRCNCPECRDESRWDRFRAGLDAKGRELRRHHYHWSFDHYRHEHHPECPPYCSPSWGYYQTCWRRFPEHTLWCPPCQDGPGAVVPQPAPVAAPTPAPVSPVPSPPAPLPMPAPMPEDPAYETSPADEETSLLRPARIRFDAADDRVDTPFVEPAAAETPPISLDEPLPPVHPRNRWRMQD